MKTTSNISTLIRDLFHNPPSFRSTVLLSWIEAKPTVRLNPFQYFYLPVTPSNTYNTIYFYLLQGVKAAMAGKRHAPITFGAAGNGSQAKKKREANSPAQGSSEQRLYKTPSGKYSGKVSNYSPNNSRQRKNRNNQGKNRNFRNKYWTERRTEWGAVNRPWDLLLKAITIYIYT